MSEGTLLVAEVDGLLDAFPTHPLGLSELSLDRSDLGGQVWIIKVM